MKDAKMERYGLALQYIHAALSSDDPLPERFGRLVVVKEAGRSKTSERLVWVECDCGTLKIVHYRNISRGATRSCGCHRVIAFEERLRRRRQPAMTVVREIIEERRRAAEGMPR